MKSDRSSVENCARKSQVRGLESHPSTIAYFSVNSLLSFKLRQLFTQKTVATSVSICYGIHILPFSEWKTLATAVPRSIHRLSNWLVEGTAVNYSCGSRRVFPTDDSSWLAAIDGVFFRYYRQVVCTKGFWFVDHLHMSLNIYPKHQAPTCIKMHCEETVFV